MAYDINTFLNELSHYSQAGPGVTRLAFTKESQEARNYICRVMEGLGLNVKTDIYGTIAGHLEGQRKESVIIGSHYDSVVHGGMYDGATGIAIGLAVAARFRKNGKMLPCSLDILATNDEEGVRLSNAFLSSKSMCSLLDVKTYKNAVTGECLASCLDEGWYSQDGKGGDDLRLGGALKNAIQYIEPHIEQGGILWENGERIGIVKHIVGLTRLYITIYGLGNHAGTTPMDLRKDPMAAAGRVIGLIPDLAAGYKGAVATVGQVFVSPNVSNVIPQKVEFSVDIRSASDQDRNFLADQVKLLVAEESPIHFEIAQTLNEAAVPMNERMVRAMEHICKAKSIPSRVMNSGAGHDAQLFGAFLDTVMLFVPSRDGISHSPEEYSRIEDMDLAADVLEDYITNIKF